MNQTIQSVMDIQSPALLTLPHQQPLKSLVDDLPPGAQVLEFGLGGGTNARYIKQQRPDASVSIIEQSQTVIDWFQQYFNPHQIHLQLIRQQAEHFIVAEQNQYDLVITDLFVADNSILSCLNLEYFLQLKRIIKPDGLAYLNFLPETDLEPELIKSYLAQAGFSIIWGEKIIGFKNWVFLLMNPARLSIIN